MTAYKIGVVGPCSSGKSTLVRAIQEHGYWGKHIAQEHSYVQTMWSRITKPDILIYLDVSFDVADQRRKLDWTREDHEEQVRRLKDAREHADFYVDTDPLNEGEVRERVLVFLASLQQNGEE